MCIRDRFQFVCISTLREYLEHEFKAMPISFEFNVDAIIDDFVFMCFFIGNDFMPHLPSLRIREGAIDLMYMIYKQYLPETDGYLTNNRKPNFKRLNGFFKKISIVEGELFMLRKRKEQEESERDERKKFFDQRRKYSRKSSHKEHEKF